MPQSHARVLIHVVFSTKDRKAWIHPEIEADLFAYLAATLKALGSPALRVGGTDDHVTFSAACRGRSRSRTWSKG